MAPSNEKNEKRMIELLESLGAIGLYIFTEMNYHQIARRLGMGTQRVTNVLKGLKKIKS